MNREEIRKKWKNRELAEVSQNKLARQEETPKKQISQSTWERVQNTANQIMNIRNNPIVNVENPLLNRGKTQDNKKLNKKQYIADDARALVKGIGLGGYKGGVTALGQTEFLSQQRSDTYRKFNQRQTNIKEQKEAKTANEQLQLGLKQLQNADTSKGVLIKKQPSINESASMQYFNKKEEELNKKIAQNAETASTNAGKYLAGQVAPSMGQSLVGTGLDIIAPGMGAGYRMLSYSGNYTQDGLNKGMNENQASMYGLTMAGVETAMDTIGDKLKGIAIGEAKGANGLKNFIKTSAKELGINSFFEGSGEALTEPLQELVAKAYGGKADYEGIAKRMGEAFLAGAVSELLMTGASLGYGGSINVLNKTENGQQVSVEEVKNALNEIKDKKQINVEEVLQNNIKFAEDNLTQDNKQQQQIENSGLTDIQKQKLTEISQKYDLSNKDIQDLINNTKNGKYEQNQATTTPNNEILNQEQQTIQQEGKQAQNQMSQETGNIEQKALNLRQSIDNFNNSRTEGQEIFDINNEETKKEIESIQKIAQDRNINIIFDENRFKDNSQNAFYEYDENGNVANIILNPNATTKKYVENLAVHELVHSFSGDKKTKLMNEALNYIKTLDGYDKAYNDIKSSYEKVYGENVLEDVINEEVVANVLGEKLGSKEFVDDLVNGKYSAQNKNLAQKIYDFVKNQINRFKGYKDQEQYWKHVKELFDDAYRNSEVSQEGIKSSVERNKLTDIRDSQGRQLSKGQVDYFKDSKARDENGNLIPMYHSTSADFTIFDKEKLGDNTFYANTPFGFFVTSNKAFSERFKDIDNEGKQGKTMEVYIDAKKPITHPYNASYKYSGEELDRITREWLEATDEAEGLEDLETMVEEGDSESLWDAYMELMFSEDPYEIAEDERKILESKGYDAVEFVEGDEKTVIEESGSNEPVTSYAVFNSNQIKNIDNTNPTNNPDIRFSQETQDAWNNFIEKYFKTEGTGTAIKDMKKLPEMSITKYQEVLDNAKYIPQEDKQNLLSYLEDIKKNKSSLDDFKKIVNDLNENYRLSIDTEQQNQQPVEQTVKEEKINLVPTKKVESEQTKQRKHYESIMKSSETSKEAKSIAKKLLGTDTYVPDSNKAQLERADQRIGANPDNELNVLTSKIDNGDRLNATDIAVSERLIEYYSKIGDLEKLETAIQNTALAGTQLGQSVQALSLINRQTPVGQVTYIERTIKKLNQEILNNKGYTQNSDGKILNRKGEDVTDKVELFNFTPEMQQKILNSNKDNIDSVLEDVYNELGEQVTKSTHQKIDSWRYFAMLGNLRTHLRNIVGNLGMGGTQRVKNIIASGIEDVAGAINPKMERTKTLRKKSDATKEFAKNDIKNVTSELGLNSNKYTAQNRLRDNMKEFKTDLLNNTLGQVYGLNNTALEVEDGWGLKSAYVDALGDYITANKLDVNNISEVNLRKARKYAIQQAQEATFHQASALASWINQASQRSKAGKAITDAVLPFVKTPINVAKSGLEYNPVGLVYNSIKGIHDLNTGKITVNQYIDNISKGLTGTGISVLGYALASAGIVKASGGDDDKEKYEQDRGNQAYSIKIGNNTYSLDWLSPVGIPFFVGVEAYEIMNAKKKEKTSLSTDDDSVYKQAIKSATNMLNAFATSMNPMAEMSMLSGLTSALRSYEQGSVQMFSSLMANAGKSYINQFVPTMLGQVARVTDSKQRSTKSTATGTLGKALDQTKNQIMAKIPGLRQKLPVATDIWGKELQNDDNITRRAFETFIAPYTRKDLKTSKLDTELNDLYDKTGDASIYPDKLDKTFKIDKQDYRLTNEEYVKYSKDYGQNSYNILSNLVNSNDYQNLDDSQKQKAINKAYEYAKEANKVNYANKINKEIETDALYDVMSNIPSDIEKGKYLVYLAETSEDDIKDKDKKSYILNSNMKDSTKEAIYRNSLGKKDKLYTTLYAIDKVNINGYLDYSARDIKSDPDEESDIEGDTIYGTKKINVVNALKEISNLSVFDKLYIYGKLYKLETNEKRIVDNKIRNSNLSQEEKDEAFKDLSKSNIIKYKDGSYEWKDFNPYSKD